MGHDVLRSVLEAQQANATLSGASLRAAARDLAALANRGSMVVKAFDAAGERIIGASLVLSESIEPWDYSRPLPPQTTCVLVGGIVVGPAGVAAAARAARSAGAERIEVALLGSGLAADVPDVDGLHEVGQLGIGARSTPASAA